MIVARPLHSNEPDLLAGRESAALRYMGLDQRTLLVTIPAPSSGWTHEALENSQPPVEAWDAFLDFQWVGSSEV